MRNKFLVCLLVGLLIVSGVAGVTAVSPTSAPADSVTTPGSPIPDRTPLDGPTYVEQVVELVNEARWANGQLPPLKAVDLLHNSSQTHSDNMANRNFFAHCDLDTGDSPWDRMIDAGYNYNWAGENIAAGYGTPTEVMNGWMGSSGHRANILSSNFRELGVGYAYQGSDQGNVRGDSNGDCAADQFNRGPYYRYWTQNFGTRSTVYPVVIDREAYETVTRQVSLYIYGAGWAVDMRFRNESGSWSGWQPYAANVNWTLSNGNGTKTVYAEIRNGSGTVRAANDSILLNAAVVEPIIGLSPSSFTVLREVGSTAQEQVTLQISNGGTEVLNWSITEQPAASWLAVSPSSGSTNGGQESSVTVTVNPQGVVVGHYAAQLVVSGNATNSPQSVDVTLIVSEQIYDTYLPFIIRD